MKNLFQLRSIAPSSTHLGFIDGLRGIAILMVVANHAYLWVLANSHEKWLTTKSKVWITTGNRGVLLFFLVSAFTLFLSCEKRFENERHPLINFFIRRIFRILPCWWLALFVYAGFNPSVLFEHLCCLFMLFGFSLKETHLFFPGWTLFVEETFYVFLPFLLPLLIRVRTSLILFVGFLGLRFLWLAKSHAMPFVSEHVFANLFPFSHWYAFVLGILVRHVSKSPSIFKKCFSGPFPWLWDIATATAIAGLLVTEADWGVNEHWGAVSLALLFFTSISERTLLGRIARMSALRALGICCYSIYLFHPYLIGILSSRLRRWLISPLGIDSLAMEIQFLVIFPLISFILLALGWMCFVCLERPCVRLGKRLIHVIESFHFKGAPWSPPLS